MNLLLSLVALATEVAAPRLAGFGFLSLSHGWLLWLALSQGSLWAAGVGLAGLLLRSLRWGSARWVTEVLLDLLPLLAMLMVLAAWSGNPMLGALVGLQLHLALTAMLPGLVAPGLEAEVRSVWEESRFNTVLLRAAAGALGVLGSLSSSPTQPLLGLWLVPVALSLHQASRWQCQHGERLLRHRLGRRLQETESQLMSAQETLTSTQEQLSERSEAFEVLHRFSHRLHECDSVWRAFEALLEVAGQLVDAQTLVIFDRELKPRWFRGPLTERLRGWELTGEREPLLEQVFASRRPLRTRWTQGFFAGEDGLATCLEDQGLLYVGSQRPLRESQLELVGVLAELVGATLRSLGQKDALRALAQSESALNQHLQDWLQQVGALLESLQLMAASLEPEQQRKGLERALDRLAPHQRRRIFLGEWPGPGTLEHELVELLRSRPGPLLLDDLKHTRFAPLGGSLLAFALGSEQEMVGAVLLADDRAGAFSRGQQQLTGLLALQASLAWHNAELHQQSLQAFRQLQESQSQMIVASKLAAVGQLAAGMAHELNTPLATVLMAVEMASLEASPESLVHLQLASRQVARAQGLIEKVLYYSRDARAGRQPVGVKELVEDSLVLVASDLRSMGVRVESSLLDSGPLLLGNVNELQQVVLNLLLNARDALEGVVEPVLRVSSRLEEGVWVVEFEDNGCGLSAEVRERVFDPFFTTKPPGKGTGLGLSISREIVAQHAGQLELIPLPKGCCARLKLPIQA